MARPCVSHLQFERRSPPLTEPDRVWLSGLPSLLHPPLSSYLFIFLISLTSKARARGEVGAAIQVGLGSRSSGSVSFADYPVAQSGNVLFFLFLSQFLAGLISLLFRCFAVRRVPMASVSRQVSWISLIDREENGTAAASQTACAAKFGHVNIGVSQELFNSFRSCKETRS